MALHNPTRTERPKAVTHGGVSFMGSQYHAVGVCGSGLLTSGLCRSAASPTGARSIPLPFRVFRGPLVALAAMRARKPRLDPFGRAKSKAGQIPALPGYNSFSKRDAERQSLAQRVVVDTANAGPLGNSAALSINGHDTINAAIVLLLTSAGPVAIIRRIGAVIVAALDRLAVPRLAHVREEVGKITPPVADGYAAPAVVLVGGTIRVPAALPHCGPRHVRFGSARAVTLMKRSHVRSAITRPPGMLAPARNRAPGSQVVLSNTFLRPASAPAKPIPLPLRVGPKVCQQSMRGRFHDRCVAFNGV